MPFQGIVLRNGHDCKAELTGNWTRGHCTVRGRSWEFPQYIDPLHMPCSTDLPNVWHMILGCSRLYIFGSSHCVKRSLPARVVFLSSCIFYLGGRLWPQVTSKSHSKNPIHTLYSGSLSLLKPWQVRTGVRWKNWNVNKSRQRFRFHMCCGYTWKPL